MLRNTRDPGVLLQMLLSLLSTSGTMAGIMNCVGWLGGGGTASVVIGLIAARWNLGLAIAAAAAVYCVAGALLIASMFLFVERDITAMRGQMLETAKP